jgi:hypothetical protein
MGIHSAQTSYFIFTTFKSQLVLAFTILRFKQMNRVISPSYNAITSDWKQLLNSITCASGDRIALNSTQQVIDLSNKTVVDNRNFFDGVIIKMKAAEGFGLVLTNKLDLYYLSFRRDCIESFFLCSNVLDFWPFLNVFYLMVQTSNSRSFFFGKRDDFEQAVRRKRNYSEDLLDDGKSGHLMELAFMRIPNGEFVEFSCSGDHFAFLMRQNIETSVYTCGSNKYFKCGHPIQKPLTNYFHVSKFCHVQDKIKAIVCTNNSTIMLSSVSNALSQLYVIGGEAKHSIQKIDLIATACKLFSSYMSGDVVAVCETRGALLFQNSNFRRQEIVLRQKKVESISFMGGIIFGRGNDIVNMFSDLSKEKMRQCSDVDIHQCLLAEKDPKLKNNTLDGAKEQKLEKVASEEIEENEDVTCIYFDNSKFTPPPAPEVDPLDLKLRDYSIATYERRFQEAHKIDSKCIDRENKRRKII